MRPRADADSLPARGLGRSVLPRRWEPASHPSTRPHHLRDSREGTVGRPREAGAAVVPMRFEG